MGVSAPLTFTNLKSGIFQLLMNWTEVNIRLQCFSISSSPWNSLYSTFTPNWWFAIGVYIFQPRVEDADVLINFKPLLKFHTIRCRHFDLVINLLFFFYFHVNTWLISLFIADRLSIFFLHKINLKHKICHNYINGKIL